MFVKANGPKCRTLHYILHRSSVRNYALYVLVIIPCTGGSKALPVLYPHSLHGGARAIQH